MALVRTLTTPPCSGLRRRKVESTQTQSRSTKEYRTQKQHIKTTVFSDKHLFKQQYRQRPTCFCTLKKELTPYSLTNFDILTRKNIFFIFFLKVPWQYREPYTLRRRQQPLRACPQPPPDHHPDHLRGPYLLYGRPSLLHRDYAQ